MKKNIIVSVLLVFAITGALFGCGSGSGVKTDYATGQMAPAASPEMYMEGETAGGFAQDGAKMLTNDSAMAPMPSPDGGISVPQEQRKIIYTAYLNLETLEFEKTVSDIENDIKAQDGYIANTNFNGGGIDYKIAGEYRSIGDTTQSYNNRNYNITAKIPTAKYNDFVKTASTRAILINKSENSNDITAQYVDTEARLTTLRTQEKRLLELLEKADNLQDMLTIEARLSDIRYQLESYTSQLNSMKNQVEYSTITLDIREVKTPTATAKTTYIDRLILAVKNSLNNTVEGLGDFVIALIYALPSIIILALLLLIAVIIYNRKFKKAKPQITVSKLKPEDNPINETDENK